jgi:drug/metabolite transporter (DMT)-like permease
MPERRPLDPTAVATMLALTLCWGFQQVAIKVAAGAVPLLMQASLRSIVATLLVVLWARTHSIRLFERDATLAPGAIAGVAFAVEFALIYGGLDYTTAARMIIFVYLAPCVTAVGLAWLVPGERLSPLQWLGVWTSFAGVAIAFADGAFGQPSGRSTLPGDLAGVLAAFLWGGTTVLIRATPLARIEATRVLFYQLAVSALLLPIAAWAAGERTIGALTPVVVASLAFQSVVVAFATYLAWFWLLTRYLANRLAVFSFVAPLAGVAFGTLLLGEPLTPGFVTGAALVLVGIALVNLRPARA